MSLLTSRVLTIQCCALHTEGTQQMLGGEETLTLCYGVGGKGEIQ